MFINNRDETYNILAQLPDFTMYKMKAHNGTYVQGFGQAFEQDNDGNWQHLKG